MFIHHFFLLGMKEIEESWNTNYEQYKSEILRGFTFALQALEEQLGVASSREGFGADFGFDLDIMEKKVSIQIAARPHMWGCFFHLHPNTRLSFPFELSTLEGARKQFPSSTPLCDWGEIRNSAGRAARRFTADFARDGLPKEMKQAISLIGQAERLRYHIYTAKWQEVQDYMEIRA